MTFLFLILFFWLLNFFKHIINMFQCLFVFFFFVDNRYKKHFVFIIKGCVIVEMRVVFINYV